MLPFDKFNISPMASTNSDIPLPHPEKNVTILSITDSEDDHTSLDEILSQTRWRTLRAQSLREAVPRFPECQVVLCEAKLSDGNWKDALDEIELQSGSGPRQPLIVTSRLADDHLWTEVLDRGAYNLIAKPYDSKELLRLISLAWRFWKDQCGRLDESAFRESLESLGTKIGPSRSEAATPKYARLLEAHARR